MSGERSLVVSLHDVSPLTRPIFEPMIAELRELGVGRCSLLVIPDHHHRGHMLADAGFCRWLEGLARQGHEIVAHGYYHQRAPRPAETWRQRLMTRVYTQGEGEFYDLSRDEAAALLARGNGGFCAAGRAAADGIHRPGVVAERRRAGGGARGGFPVHDVSDRGRRPSAADGGGFIPARSLVYSPRNRWRRACSLAWNGGLARWLEDAPLLRLGLHPPDYQHTNLWRQVRRIAGDAAAKREVTTYGDFVTVHRAD